MEEFECDHCGACCQGHLIVQVDELDILREPRLIGADPHYSGESLAVVLTKLRDDFGRAVIIAGGIDRSCPFLGVDHECTIYPTRPNDCVGMQAGDAQCQEVRKAAGLPPLEPKAE